IDRGDGKGMRAFRQRAVGGPAPVTVRLYRYRHRGCCTVYGDDNGGTRFAGAREGRRAVTGIKHIACELAVRHRVNQRDFWRSGIYGDREDRAEAADVTRGIDCRNGDVEWAISLGRKIESPLAIAADFDAS